MRDHFIKKGNHLYYRDNRSGYTSHILYAGLYTKEEAEAAARVEPWHMKAVPVKNFDKEILDMAARVLTLRSAVEASA